jgi:hypothetical protein
MPFGVFLVLNKYGNVLIFVFIILFTFYVQDSK